MSYIVAIIVAILSLYIAEVTRRLPDPPKKPGLNEIEFPTADATRKYPVIWGRPLLRGPNLTYYGGLKTYQITKKIKGVFKSSRQVTGHRFHLDMQMCFGVSRGSARLLKLKVGDTEVWTGSLTSGAGVVSQPTIFGGDESEGGVEGPFNFWPGGPDQMQDPYLSDASRLGAKLPAYRSSIRFVWAGGYLGNSKYIKEFAAQIESLPVLLGSGLHNINGHANPAEIFYEMLVDQRFGIYESPSNVNIPTFLAGASQLYAEGFGLTLIWDGSRPLDEVRKELQRTIDGAIFKNVLTGKWELKLNRRLTSEQIAALPLLANNANVKRLSFSRPGVEELVNEVYVSWTQEGETSNWPAKAQNLGTLTSVNGEVVSVTNSYPAVPNYELADKLAWRDLAAQGSALDRLTLEGNRELYALTPLSKFRYAADEVVTHPADVYVVIDIDYGTLEDNTVTIEAVQDVFDLGPGFSIGGSGGSWEDVSTNPVIPTVYRMEFTPYALLQIQDEVVNSEAAVPMLLVEAPTEGHLEFKLQYSDPSLPGGGMAEAANAQEFTPTGKLSYDYFFNAANDTSGTLHVDSLRGITAPVAATVADIRSLAAGLILIDNEWMAITAVTQVQQGGVPTSRWQLSVMRGLMDSVIADHYAGARVWFVGVGTARTPTEVYPWLLGTYLAKIQTVTLSGTLDISLAPTASIVSNSFTQNVRPLWAYPVARLQVAGSLVPPVIAALSTLQVTFRERNRAGEVQIYFNYETTGLSREADVTYRYYLYDGQGVLLSSTAETTANVHTFNPMTLPNQRYPNNGYVEVESIRPVYGAGPRARMWFSLQVMDQTGIIDEAAQNFIDESSPWAFWRLND